MKTLKYTPSKRKHYPIWFSTRQQMVEMVGYIKCKADVKAFRENPGEFFEEKRGCTDSASDRAFIGLAKQLKSSIC